MASSHIKLEIIERDEAGNVVATYVQSAPSSATGVVRKNDTEPAFTSASRIDTIYPEKAKPVLQRVLDIFLPVNYPASVTQDYLWYQIYDSLQAFSSSIAGLLCSRAVLEGVGVGDASASPTTALLHSIAQETVSRLATIAFAARLGTAFEPECKMYRLLADVFNDVAMLLECLSPLLPSRSMRLVILCAASVGKALCGVAAGSAKASLSSHFAKQGNLGELNAKDASQETVISLMGMLAGSVIVPRVVSTTAIWTMLILLLAIHLGTNYLAVRAVSMRTLNRQRTNILFSVLADSGKLLDPVGVSKQERVFERDGVLRWRTGQILGFCRMGVSLGELLAQVHRADPPYLPASVTKSWPNVEIEPLLRVFAKERYVLWFDTQTRLAIIVLKQDASTKDQLKAWAHALLLAKSVADEHGQEMLPMLKVSLSTTTELLERHEQGIIASGFDMDVGALQVRPGTRIAMI